MSARERARLRWMFPQLKEVMPDEPATQRGLQVPNVPASAHVTEARRWNVRGEPRTRATFGLPHPDDFQGGLPQPREYPGG